MQQRQKTRNQTRIKSSRKKKARLLSMILFGLLLIIGGVGSVGYHYLYPHGISKEASVPVTSSKTLKSNKKAQPVKTSKSSSSQISSSSEPAAIQTPSVEENKEEVPTPSQNTAMEQSTSLSEQSQSTIQSTSDSNQQSTTTQADQAAQEQAREEQVQQLTKEYEANGYNVNVVRGQSQ
ncbi:hypothetical protein OGZ37_03900 [Lactococcus lactis]|uniref:hypothetical protein n=1 Tax=Lactococcus lactis TaxID=1358 RepID=UPI0024188913|nr:hypothetical protein [Lactococcus lactis]MDG4965721.1 hypothetical protein [Lactococcus lactis]